MKSSGVYYINAPALMEVLGKDQASRESLIHKQRASGCVFWPLARCLQYEHTSDGVIIKTTYLRF